LKSHLRITIEALLRSGVGLREVELHTGVDRKTSGATRPWHIRQRWPPAEHHLIARKDCSATTSACEPHCAWIEAQVALGRNAVNIFQDLVESHRFAHQYNSVKRYDATLKARAPSASTCDSLNSGVNLWLPFFVLS
jgi:hypothetical protein